MSIKIKLLIVYVCLIVVAILLAAAIGLYIPQISSQQLLIFCIAIILLFIVVTFALVNSIVGSLEQLTKDALRIVQGDLNGSVSERIVKKEDEMGALARAFDELLKKFRGEIQARTAESAQAIRHSHSNERRLQQVLDSTPNAIIMVNKEGKIVLVNKMTESLFGYSRQELLFQSIENLIPQQFRAKHPDHRKEYLRHPEIRSMGAGRDLFGLRKDGTQVLVEIGLNPVETPEGQFVLASVVDITERKTAELRLQKITTDLLRSNEELEQFAYVASHDLQEPLRMVASYTQLLERRYKDVLDNEAREFIAYAVDGANRMQRLISDLLSFSRVGTRGKPFAKLDGNAVCQAALTNLKVAIEESKTQIHYGSLPNLVADETQMLQLFQNAIGNAIKFRKDGEPPRIDISAKETPEAWEFCIQDNGIGMEPKYTERAFVIFERLHSTGKYEGTGIGLAVCKKIVERHGGRVWIESEVNKGTKFHFTILKKTG